MVLDFLQGKIVGASIYACQLANQDRHSSFHLVGENATLLLLL